MTRPPVTGHDPFLFESQRVQSHVWETWWAPLLLFFITQLHRAYLDNSMCGLLWVSDTASPDFMWPGLTVQFQGWAVMTERWEGGGMWRACPHCGDITACWHGGKKTPGVWHLDWIVPAVCASTWCSCTLVRVHVLACVCVYAGASPCLPGCVRWLPCALSVWQRNRPCGEFAPWLKADVRDAAPKWRIIKLNSKLIRRLAVQEYMSK